MPPFVLLLFLLCDDPAVASSVACSPEGSLRPRSHPSLAEGLELTLDDHTHPEPSPTRAALARPPLDESIADEVFRPPPRMRFEAAPIVSLGADASAVLSGGIDGAPSYGVDALSTRVLGSATFELVATRDGVEAGRLLLARGDSHALDAIEHAALMATSVEPNAVEAESRWRATVVEYRTAPSQLGCFVSFDAPPTCGATRTVILERLEP